MIQAVAAVVVVAYDFGVTYGLLKLIGSFIPLREKPEVLERGDTQMHGEIAYA